MTKEEDTGRRTTGATPGFVRGMGWKRRVALLWMTAEDGDEDDDASGCRCAVGDGANRA